MIQQAEEWLDVKEQIDAINAQTQAHNVNAALQSALG